MAKPATPTASRPPRPTFTEIAGAPAATRSISSASPGISVGPTAASIGMRRSTPRSGSTLTSARPAAAASMGAMLWRPPSNRGTNRAGSPPKARTGETPRSARLIASGTSTPATASTTGRPRSVSASTASLLGMPASFRVTTGSSPSRIPARRPGESRSGSGISTSSPMAAGRASASLATSRASQVRGHGHWPYRRRLSSSMVTMTTGAERGTRGARAW